MFRKLKGHVASFERKGRPIYYSRMGSRATVAVVRATFLLVGAGSMAAPGPMTNSLPKRMRQRHILIS